MDDFLVLNEKEILQDARSRVDPGTTLATGLRGHIVSEAWKENMYQLSLEQLQDFLDILYRNNQHGRNMQEIRYINRRISQLRGR